MKNVLIALLFLPLMSFAQVETTNTLEFGGESREFLSYVPAMYDGSEAVPIVFCLHGLGDNMNNFSNIGMNLVADTANFIVITPQALVDDLTQSAAWNSGAGAFGIFPNTDVDDVGFISAMIDTLAADYNIDLSRVYSCGFSMGGFMSQRLACELNDRIAAIASVAGTIGNDVSCNPGNNVPVCHFHGTVDSTVAYEGNTFGSDAEDTVEFWVDNNGCDTDSVHTNLPDLFVDGYTVEHTIYLNCNDEADVEHFKVNGANHVWLGQMNDISYTPEIWKFFLNHENIVGVNEIENTVSVSIYPNPTNSFTYLEFNAEKRDILTVQIIDAKGSTLMGTKETIFIGANLIELNLSHLSSGIYTINAVSNNGVLFSELLVID